MPLRSDIKILAVFSLAAGFAAIFSNAPGVILSTANAAPNEFLNSSVAPQKNKKKPPQKKQIKQIKKKKKKKKKTVRRKFKVQPWRRWSSPKYSDHLLAGRIWWKVRDIYLSPHELVAQLVTKDFILIGEVHDNPDHHFLQAWLIRKIARHDRKPAIVMEMIDETQSPALEAYLSKAKAPAGGLGKAIGWSHKGWPDWKIYLPVVRAVYSEKLILAAGSPSPETLRGVRKEGWSALGTERRKDLALASRLQPFLLRDLRKELKEAHCGLIPDTALGRMGRIQQLRDAQMADQLLKAGGRKGAILIAGNGHLRTDRGVPLYLRRRRPDDLTASVMLIEVHPDGNTPEDLAPTGLDGLPVADYVWFTPRHERPDPCRDESLQAGPITQKRKPE